MKITKVRLKIRPEMRQRYEDTFMKLRELVRAKEPGCTFFELCRDAESDHVYHVFEAYADDAAVEAHVTAPWYKETARVFVECLQGDHMPEIEARQLEGRAMYQVVQGMGFERHETVLVGR